MKRLMLGNEAVARGAYEAGVTVAAAYPGTPSTEITEQIAKYDQIYSEWSPNEKVALEVAVGAAIAGARAICSMKHVGLNVAADPLFTASYTGVNAGLVIMVADDPGMHSSQNEQDSRHYAIASKLPMLEPSDSAECLAFTKLAYELSEHFDTPVILRLSTRISHSQSIVEISDRVEPVQKEYKKDPAKFVMMPAMARGRHVVVEERTDKLRKYAEATPINVIELHSEEIGVITSGTSYNYAKEALGDSVSYLKLGLLNPLPVKLIQDFSCKVKRLYVIEELDPVIETHCKAIGLSATGKELFPIIGEFSQRLVAERILHNSPEFTKLEENIPVRPPVMCPGCPHRGVFYILSKLKLMVNGDIGCYTLGAAAPLNAMDTTVCMGFSVSGLHGYHKAMGEEAAKKSVAVIGDSTFIHSGITGLVNVAYNQSNSTVIILDNSITGMTGHQQNPTTGYTIKGDPTAKISLEKLCNAVGINRVRVVDPLNLKELETAIREETEADEPSVIIARRPCALLKYVKHKPPLVIDRNKCVACKSCFKIGCPAIVMADGKAQIDNTLCVGCDLCTSLCKFGAIGKKEEA